MADVTHSPVDNTPKLVCDQQEEEPPATTTGGIFGCCARLMKTAGCSVRTDITDIHFCTTTLVTVGYSPCFHLVLTYNLECKISVKYTCPSPHTTLDHTDG